MQRARRLSTLYIKILRCSRRFPKTVLYHGGVLVSEKTFSNQIDVSVPFCQESFA
jgi:hypothetical protein